MSATPALRAKGMQQPHAAMRVAEKSTNVGTCLNATATLAVAGNGDGTRNARVVV
jgi:hypothetical protein